MNARLVAGWVALALLAFGFLTATLIAVRQPLGHGDYIAIWGLKARALYRSGELASVFRVDPAGDFSHPEYPPLWPLTLAGAARLVGRFDELELSLLRPLLLAIAVALAFRATSAPWPLRLLAAAALSLLPYFRTPLYVGYSEALLLVFVLGAFSELRLGGPADIAGRLRFEACWILAGWTKLEGLVMAAGFAAALIATRRRRLGFETLAAVSAFSFLPWYLLRHALQTQEPRATFALSAASLGKLLEAASAVFRVALVPNLAWVLGAACVLALAASTRRRRRAELIALGLFLSAMLLSFGFSRLDVEWHVVWSWDRLGLIPVACLIPILMEAVSEATDDANGVAPVEPAQ